MAILAAVLDGLRRLFGRARRPLLDELALETDPKSLPLFVQAAEILPPEQLPELARLMLRFGPPAYPHLLAVVNKHPGAFPPDRLAELLRLAAKA